MLETPSAENKRETPHSTMLKTPSAENIAEGSSSMSFTVLMNNSTVKSGMFKTKTNEPS